MINNDIFINENNYKDILKIGIIKNKDLVEIFGTIRNKETYNKTKKVTGSMKKLLLNRALVYCNIKDLTRGKYEIIEIYTELKNNSIREKYRIKDYPFINYDKEYDFLNGVYSIELDNKIYIGSTIAGFRNRHSQYYSNLNTNKFLNKGSELIADGGKINILWSTESKNEYEVRLKEIEYINYYNDFTSKEVVNSSDKVVVLNNKRKINKKKRKRYRKIMVDSDYYDAVLKFLKDNKIERKTTIK